VHIAKGCATDEEQQQAEAWIGTAPEEHQPILDHIVDLYQRRNDAEAALGERVLQKVAAGLPGVFAEMPIVVPIEAAGGKRWRSLFGKWAVAAAAALLLLLTLGRQGLIRDMIGAGHHEETWKVVCTAYGQEATVALPDGSAVRLAPGSRLSYPEHFKAGERQVQLTGAAFFDVRKNPQQPFTVQTGKLFTKVLGTSFEVVAYPGELQSTVTLITGKVLVHQRNSRNQWQALACLTPNKKLTLKHQTATFVVDSISNRTSSDIRDGRLVFENATLAGIAAGLERRFNIRTRFAPGCRPAKHISATFDQSMSLQDISLVLSRVSGLHITSGKDSMYISYSGGH